MRRRGVVSRRWWRVMSRISRWWSFMALMVVAEMTMMLVLRCIAMAKVTMVLVSRCIVVVRRRSLCRRVLIVVMLPVLGTIVICWWLG